MKKSSSDISASLVGITFLVLIVFAVLKWLNIPTGDFMDWAIGVGCFWWLLLITTVPWNMHFKAKEILSDVKESQNTGISVENIDVEYANKISKTYLFVAIFLHILSAIGLYFLAKTGVSVVGYVGAAFALALTALRPSVRMYEYISYRLSNMSQRIKYPREDINKVTMDLEDLKYKVDMIAEKLNHENPTSWISKKDNEIQELRESMRQIRQNFETLNVQMNTNHQALVKQTENKIASLSEDAQFLNQARQLVRFIKEA
ncbi:hypothetical protein [Bernardetia sp.]|uniref:hypothetical protein n=1 Tax=Bernardetia sp. TaxID=1937974 RepID=UPI0025B9DA31|nr:hypothetical protein [Bernardetia sp.]